MKLANLKQLEKKILLKYKMKERKKINQNRINFLFVFLYYF